MVSGEVNAGERDPMIPDDSFIMETDWFKAMPEAEFPPALEGVMSAEEYFAAMEEVAAEHERFCPDAPPWVIAYAEYGGRDVALHRYNFAYGEPIFQILGGPTGIRTAMAERLVGFFDDEGEARRAFDREAERLRLTT